MLTIAPGTILKTFWEKLLQPPIFWLIMLMVGGKQVNDDHKSNAIGNGQYMLFDRDAYERIGGHVSVKDRIVEDYALARLMKKTGYKLRFVMGKDVAAVRMYDSLGTIWTGWRKNFYTVSENRMFWKAFTRNLLMLIFLVLPFFVFGYGVLQIFFAHAFNIYLITGTFMAFWLWLGMIILYRSIGLNPAYAFLFPVAILFYIGIGVDSTMRGVLGLGFQWKGRFYGQQDKLDKTVI
jgi:cellulose synthase/poly-beta-1,6-N-acetylglucosamine synthase-like glycosyltransferase